MARIDKLHDHEPNGIDLADIHKELEKIRLMLESIDNQLGRICEAVIALGSKIAEQ